MDDENLWQTVPEVHGHVNFMLSRHTCMHALIQNFKIKVISTCHIAWWHCTLLIPVLRTCFFIFKEFSFQICFRYISGVSKISVYLHKFFLFSITFHSPY